MSRWLDPLKTGWMLASCSGWDSAPSPLDLWLAFPCSREGSSAASVRQSLCPLHSSRRSRLRRKVLNFSLRWMARLESPLQMNYILFTICVCVRVRVCAMWEYRFLVYSGEGHRKPKVLRDRNSEKQ